MAFEKPHPFLPRAAQSPKFLKWLRRTHAWFGVFGASVGLLFSVTAIFLSHHDFGIDTTTTDTTVDVTIPEGVTIDSAETLGVFLKDELGLRVDARPGMGRGMGMGGDDSLGVTFNSPGDIILANYKPGSPTISVTTQDRGFLGTINRMHLGNGIPTGWKILGDVFAGGLIFLSISGFLMWTRMHGSRLVALGLLSSTLLGTAYYFSAAA